MSQECTDIEAVDNQISYFNLRPKDMVKEAALMAKPLRDVIEQQQLFTMMNGKKYVNVEGWQTLGNMLGILPRDKKVIEHPDGSFEAYVDLVNYKTGLVVGGGSALCGMDEKRWSKADRYARRSMAITRATGKAYRLSFSWIMTMSGYQPTPTEEMPGEMIERADKTVPHLYEATDLQKIALAKYAKEFGIAQKQELIELSGAMAGIPMVALKAEIKKYLETYAGDCEI